MLLTYSDDATLTIGPWTQPLRVAFDMIIMMERCDTARNATTKRSLEASTRSCVKLTNLGAGSVGKLLGSQVAGSCTYTAARRLRPGIGRPTVARPPACIFERCGPADRAATGVA